MGSRYLLTTNTLILSGGDYLTLTSYPNWDHTEPKRKEATCRDLHRVTLKEKLSREFYKNKTVSHLISHLNPQIRYEIP